MNDSPNSKITIGWREFIALPDWGIRRIKAKIDTGARTSALHVSHLQTISGDRVRFDVVVRERPKRRVMTLEADVLRVAKVKPSSGVRQVRYVVETTMRLGSVDRRIEVSLVDRAGMLCRMLIGRRALSERFIVDPGERYLLSGRNSPSRDETNP